MGRVLIGFFLQSCVVATCGYLTAVVKDTSLFWTYFFLTTMVIIGLGAMLKGVFEDEVKTAAMDKYIISDKKGNEVATVWKRSQDDMFAYMYATYGDTWRAKYQFEEA